MEAPKTPELDKMYAAREGLGTEDIGAFLDWASDEGMTLCESRDSEVMPWLPVRQSINDLLMRYAGIDPESLPAYRKYIDGVMAAAPVAAVLERERIRLDTYKAA